MHTWPKCVECGAELEGSRHDRKYCSRRCKGRFRRSQGRKDSVTRHRCRICAAWFPIQPDQGNKWLCSDACRRASAAKSVREFHKRQPEAEAIYRARTTAKQLPDGNNIRFYRHNPDAPRACESCGESRVVETAHKPHKRRYGAHRSSKNCKWPEMVWVLCPTCHVLLDRMHYPPDELGLSL